MLFGASVHPYRTDAVAELERCVAAGAVLMKWLPIVQDFNPADDRCIPFYEALAHHSCRCCATPAARSRCRDLDTAVADPRAAGAGAAARASRSSPPTAARARRRSRPTTCPTFVRLAREYEHFYGDTSALCLPTRSYAFDAILQDEVVRRKLVHGSDWPIIALPPLRSRAVARRCGC